MKREEFVSDLTVRPEIVGTPAIMSSFLQFISSQRGLMLSSNAPQMMVVDGCETARIQSGYETKMGKYEFDKSSRDQDVQIVGVIPKFKINSGMQNIKNNPSLTVVYIGVDDGKVGFFEVDSYTALSPGFGYINKKMNFDQLQEGRVVDQETKFVTSPNHEDGLYKMGVNARVAYLPLWATTEDAFVISERLQKSLEHTVVDSVTIDVKIDDIPLNLYGGPDEYKAFPDIGETIREDGVVIGFRKRNKSSFLMDMTDEKLRTAEDFHDDLYKATAGATIIDVEIFTNHKKYLELCADTAYAQLMEYQKQYHSFWGNIVDVYEQMKREGREMTPAFNTLVTSCKGWCYQKGKSMFLMNKKEPIEFVRIKLTYAYQRKVNRGFKLVGNAGNKGVISDIWKDEDMPMMEDGTRADILITGASPFNRLNGGQYYEQFINYTSDVVCRNLWTQKWKSVDEQYRYIIDYLHEVRPVFAKMCQEETKNYVEEFVEATKKHGIHMVIPPFCESISPEMVLRLAAKYGIRRSKISYNAPVGDGTRKHIVTHTDAMIGELYIHLLGKIPLDQMNAVEFGYTNQFQAPIKPGSKTLKAQCVFGQTPIRYGEDETAILTMCCGAMIAMRILCTYSNSLPTIDELQRRLLTDPHPSAILDLGIRTENMILDSSNVGIFNHQLAATGFEIEILKETA